MQPLKRKFCALFAAAIPLAPSLLPAQDTTPPDTTITSGPSGLTTNNNPTFTFDSSEAGSTFEAKIDTGALAPATSPKTYLSLADGSHTFMVRATDASHNTDLTPASRTFTVDSVAPDTSITSGPSGTTSNASPSFTFTGTEIGSTFQAQLDGSGFVTASSPASYNKLSDGLHTFQVLAIDAAGNNGAAASRTFTVDTVPPDTAITGGPSGTTSNASPAFSFTSTEIGSTFEAKIDTGSFGAVTSPTSYSGLSDGIHTFQVRAIDDAGNPDASPASRSFTVDTIDPSTLITSGPSGLVTTNRATFGFTSTELPSTFGKIRSAV